MLVEKIDENLVEEDIREACKVLNQGGVILYPTDTVWGIGCDATNEEAVSRVYGIKKRSDSKATLVLLDNISKLGYYVEELPDIALDLIELSENPLTIIYSGARNLAPGLIAPDGTIGIRITRELFSRNLCRRFRKPVVSTSANISGDPTPALFSEINPQIIRSVDYVVRSRQGETQRSEPSAIIQVGKGGVIRIIRK